MTSFFSLIFSDVERVLYHNSIHSNAHQALTHIEPALYQGGEHECVCVICNTTIFHSNEVLSMCADDITVILAIAVLDSIMDYVSCSHIKVFKYCSHSNLNCFCNCLALIRILKQISEWFQVKIEMDCLVVDFRSLMIRHSLERNTILTVMFILLS